MTVPIERPRGVRAGTPLLDRSPVRKDDAVVIRDAFGKDHTAIAQTDPQWGYDFPVIWVRMIDGKPGHHVPWPIEDVRGHDDEMCEGGYYSGTNPGDTDGPWVPCPFCFPEGGGNG